ncbi:MAG: ABC transporter transmembrane domain-containing protein, partial [Heyndrickxia sp.]
MSERDTRNTHQVRRGPMRGPGHGHGFGMPVQKAKNFKGTFKRLIGYLKPHRVRLSAVFLMAILSTVFTIITPKLMGNATTKLFEGMMMKLKGVPGAKVDFDYILHILLVLAGLYIFSSLFSYFQQYVMAGVAQKTVYNLRKEVNEKLTRVPLKFY